MIRSRVRSSFATSAVVAVVLVTCLMSAPAAAQSFGIGPRLSFVRGDLPTSTPSASFIGGTVRLVGSKHHAFELSLETRTTYNELRTSRKREMPMQASMLLYPVRGPIAPYFVGGFGIYRQTLEAVDGSGVVLSSERAQETGWHLGGGLEVIINRRVGFYGDYRFRSVRLGAPGDGEEAIGIPFVDSVRLSHRGSMWTSGVAFYF